MKKKKTKKKEEKEEESSDEEEYNKKKRKKKKKKEEEDQQKKRKKKKKKEEEEEESSDEEDDNKKKRKKKKKKEEEQESSDEEDDNKKKRKKKKKKEKKKIDSESINSYSDDDRKIKNKKNKNKKKENSIRSYSSDNSKDDSKEKEKEKETKKENDLKSKLKNTHSISGSSIDTSTKIKSYVSETSTIISKSKNEKENEPKALEPKYIEEEGKPSTLNNDCYLKDDPRNKTNIINMDIIASKIMTMESIIEKEKKELFEYKDYLASLGFILTDKSSERMAKLIHYIKTKIIVLLEGPTGTSKTRTTLIAHKYIKYIENLKKNKKKEDDEKEEDELIRFNLSAETKVDDLIAKYTGDPESPAGLKIENGPFFRAFTEGNLLLLDEINLAPSSVLQCI